MTIQRAAKRLRDLSPVALLLAALLLASGSLAAEERSRPSDSNAGSRIAEPRSGGDHSWSSPPPSHSSPPPSSPSGPSGGDDGGVRSRPSDDGGRRAVPAPRDREPNRQPPRDRGGRDGDRDYRGGYWHHGSYYDPYFYPYGYWGRFGWWWGGWWLGDSYYPHYPYDHYGRRYGRYGGRDALGALDLDVAPGKTEVYLDGRYVGIVDQYDGFPQYLWLDKGTYDVVFFREGYKTLARQISIYPGTVISVDDRMERGESVRPEDLVSKSTERRDHRLREDATRREEYERRQRGGYGEDDWRDRGRRRGRVDERDRDEDREEATEEDRSESGWLRLDVEPEDASVYLDGRFVGTGRELAGLRRGLAVEPGDHHISVVRPGRQPEERDFEVEAGEETELEIELETGGER